MTDYNRITVWQPGQSLTAEDLNAEFDAIMAVVNGGLGESNFPSGVFPTAVFVHAGDPTFQTGGLDNADLVEAAIDAAVAANIKWVYIPRTLFGYAGAASFLPGIFETGIALVREGQLGAGFDPVAYGAKPDDAAVNDTPSFQAAADAAAAAAIGTNPGAAFVCVTMPGQYQLNSDVTLGADVGYIEYPQTTLAGAGAIKSADADTDKHGVVPFEGLTHKVVTVTTGTFNVGISSTVNKSLSVAYDPDDWMIVACELTLDYDAGSSVAKYYPQFAHLDDNNKGMPAGQLRLHQWNIELLAASFIHRVDVENVDGAAAHDAIVTGVYYLVKKAR